ncbi:hypothetical protein PMAYCL1PPCAC_26541, partial [Pristionchus mayeri]
GIESLQREHEHATSKDANRNHPLHSLLYDMAASLAKMAEVILAERNENPLRPTTSMHPPTVVLLPPPLPIGNIQQDEPCTSRAAQIRSHSNTSTDGFHDEEEELAIPTATTSSVAPAAPQLAEGLAATSSSDMQPLISLMQRVKQEVEEEEEQ